MSLCVKALSGCFMAAEAPRILTPPNRVYQVITNNPALLHCASFGSPIPVITW